MLRLKKVADQVAYILLRPINAGPGDNNMVNAFFLLQQPQAVLKGCAQGFTKRFDNFLI